MIIEYEGLHYEVEKARWNIKCIACDRVIKRGEYYTEAEAGERYCLECSSE